MAGSTIRKMTRRSAPLTEQSSTRATKVPGEERASTRDPEGPSEQAAPLPELSQSSNQPFYPLRLDLEGWLPRRRSWRARIPRKVWSRADIRVGEDASGKVVEQLVGGLEANGGLLATGGVGGAQNRSIRLSEPYTIGRGVFASSSISI